MRRVIVNVKRTELEVESKITISFERRHSRVLRDKKNIGVVDSDNE